MRKIQDGNMRNTNDISFVKKHTTDETVKTKAVLFAVTPIRSASFADVEADVKAFLAFVEEQKNKTNRNT